MTSDAGSYTWEQPAERPSEPLRISGPAGKLESLKIILEHAVKHSIEVNTPLLGIDALDWLSKAEDALRDAQFEKERTIS